MNKLTLQDHIDLDKLIENGAKGCEQQAFLLSRYYGLEVDYIKKMDIKLIHFMGIKMQKYIEDKDLNKKEFETKIKEITNNIKKDRNNNNNKIDNRFGILDL